PLERLLADQPAPVTLVPLGPLTSLALALRRERAVVREKLARHVAMAGNLEARGNTTPFAEFNAWCDPEALDAVLRAELPTELVGLDVTRQLVLSGHDVDRIGRATEPHAQWVHEALRFYVAFHRQAEHLDGRAVIGAGEIGSGWAALCASAGWPVTLFDSNTRILERALTEVPRRARALVALERAPQGVVESGLGEFHPGRSLLLTVQDADWVIEAISEDLIAKQRLFEAIDGIAAAETVVTSSSSGLPPTDLFARCRRQDRGLVAHPLNPPEIIPLVELVPGARTRVAALARAQEYLRTLGRMPLALKK